MSYVLFVSSFLRLKILCIILWNILDSGVYIDAKKLKLAFLRVLNG
jgi:hypothetical protein